MAFSLKARIIFPVDRPPIEHGFVTIDGERIAAVGTTAAAVEVIDLGSVALLPGLVNAHTHLEFSNLSEPLGAASMPLAGWIRLVIGERARRNLGREDAIAAGLSESLRYGITTIGDIAAGSVTIAYNDADVTAFVEVIGFSRARAASALVAAAERLEEYSQIAPCVQPGISPHAPYTVSPELLQNIVELARDQQLPVAMHLAESTDELELLHSGTGRFRELLDERSMWDEGAIPRGSRPLDFLKLLADAPRALVIHGNYLCHDERAFLAAHSDRMTVVYCPRTHEYFAHPPYPLAELSAEGVNVALGTDSRASNPDLDLLAEMRHVARMHPQIEPHDVLLMGTLGGARALGCADEVGSLTAGKLANLVAVPIPEHLRATASDSLAAVLAGDSAPCAVWLRGEKRSAKPQAPP